MECAGSWAPIRSRDNGSSFGAIVYESKFKMGSGGGYALDVVNEIEQRHNNVVQCPHLVRQGKNPNEIFVSFQERELKLIVKHYFRSKWAILFKVQRNFVRNAREL